MVIEMASNNTTVSLTEADQDFAAVARVADEQGHVVISDQDGPKYAVANLDTSPLIDLSDDEKINIVAARILKRFRPAFLELAK